MSSLRESRLADPRLAEWITAPSAEDALALRRSHRGADHELLNAGLCSQLVTGPRAQEHSTLIAFLADYSPLDWPVAVRLVNHGIHSAYQLRRLDFRALVQLIPEAAQASPTSPWSMMLKCVLGTWNNLNDARYLVAQWRLYIRDILHHLGLPHDMLFQHLQSVGLTDICQIRNLNPEQLGPLQMHHPAKLAALTARRVADAILVNLYHQFPPDLSRAYPDLNQSEHTPGESIHLAILCQDKVDGAVSPPFPPELWAIEALARGYKLSAWFLAQAIQDVFEESSRLRKLALMKHYSRRRSFAERAERVGLGFLAHTTVLDIEAPARAEALPGPRALISQVTEARKRARQDAQPSHDIIRTVPDGSPELARPYQRSSHEESEAILSCGTPVPPSGCWTFSAVTRTVILNLQRLWNFNTPSVFSETCSVCGLEISPTAASPWRLPGSQLSSDIFLITGELRIGSVIQYYSAHPECATQLSLCRPGLPPAKAWDLVSQEAQALRSCLRPPLDTLLGPRDPSHQEPHSTLGPCDTRERDWILREASLRNQLASVKGSWRSVISGIRCWAAWCDEFHRGSPHFPASALHVEQYAQFFQNGGTLGNYLGHLHFAHILVKEDYLIGAGLLRRLKTGRQKLTVHLIKPALKHEVKSKLVNYFSRGALNWRAQDDIAIRFRQPREDMLQLERRDWELAAICSVAYDRLFRVPSELLPLETRLHVPADPLEATWHSAVIWEWRVPYSCPLKAHIHLRRRKNTPLPSCLDMACKCQAENEPPLDSAAQAKLRWPDFPCACCRLYELWLLARTQSRPRVFTVTKSLLAHRLKDACEVIEVANASRVGSHAFRRGATQDMVTSGTALSTILRLGGWRSASVLHYMAIDDLENRNYALKAAEDSDSD